MSNEVNDQLFRYRRSLPKYAAKMAIHIIPGIVLGLSINGVMIKLKESLKFKPLTSIAIHVTILILILYIIETRISTRFAFEWQNITPGLFFVSILFGLQSSLFSDLSNFSKSI